MICLAPGAPVFWNFVTSRQHVYENLEKTVALVVLGRLKRLSVCHSEARSEISDLSCHVMVLIVERPMLPQLSLSKNSWSGQPILL